MDFNITIAAKASAPAIHQEALPPSPLQDQFAALAQQFELLQLQLEAQAKCEQDNALAKMRAQFALAASTEKTRETNAQRFEKDFEAFVAEMKANNDALAQENRQLKAEMLKAEARNAAAAAAYRASQKENQQQIAQLNARIVTLEAKFERHKHEKDRDVLTKIGEQPTVNEYGQRNVQTTTNIHGKIIEVPIPIYRKDPSYTGGPVY